MFRATNYHPHPHPHPHVPHTAFEETSHLHAGDAAYGTMEDVAPAPKVETWGKWAARESKVALGITANNFFCVGLPATVGIAAANLFTTCFPNEEKAKDPESAAQIETWIQVAILAGIMATDGWRIGCRLHDLFNKSKKQLHHVSSNGFYGIEGSNPADNSKRKEALCGQILTLGVSAATLLVMDGSAIAYTLNKKHGSMGNAQNPIGALNTWVTVANAVFFTLQGMLESMFSLVQGGESKLSMEERKELAVPYAAAYTLCCVILTNMLTTQKWGNTTPAGVLGQGVLVAVPEALAAWMELMKMQKKAKDKPRLELAVPTLKEALLQVKYKFDTLAPPRAALIGLITVAFAIFNKVLNKEKINPTLANVIGPALGTVLMALLCPYVNAQLTAFNDAMELELETPDRSSAGESGLGESVEYFDPESGFLEPAFMHPDPANHEAAVVHNKFGADDLEAALPQENQETHALETVAVLEAVGAHASNPGSPAGSPDKLDLGLKEGGKLSSPKVARHSPVKKYEVPKVAVHQSNPGSPAGSPDKLDLEEDEDLSTLEVARHSPENKLQVPEAVAAPAFNPGSLARSAGEWDLEEGGKLSDLEVARNFLAKKPAGASVAHESSSKAPAPHTVDQEAPASQTEMPATEPRRTRFRRLTNAIKPTKLVNTVKGWRK